MMLNLYQHRPYHHQHHVEPADEEPWRISGGSGREARFVPMQAQVGDFALFFRKAAVEITFENEQYLVVPQAAILALVREPREDIPEY